MLVSCLQLETLYEHFQSRYCLHTQRHIQSLLQRHGNGAGTAATVDSDVSASDSDDRADLDSVATAGGAESAAGYHAAPRVTHGILSPDIIASECNEAEFSYAYDQAARTASPMSRQSGSRGVGLGPTRFRGMDDPGTSDAPARHTAANLHSLPQHRVSSSLESRGIMAHIPPLKHAMAVGSLVLATREYGLQVLTLASLVEQLVHRYGRFIITYINHDGA